MQGFYFCPAAVQPHTSVYSAFCAVRANLYRTRYKTAHKALQGIFLQLCPLNSPRHQTDTSGYNTACATLERITASQHLQYIPDTRRHAGRYTGQHSRPIIIRYIRAQRCAPVIDPCQTVQHIADHASPAACDLAPVSSEGAPAGTLHPAGQSSGRGAAGGAEPLAACAATLFGLSPDS